MGITAQERVQVLDAAEIGADGDILYGAFMHGGAFGGIPGTRVLLPGNLPGRGRQVDVHVGAFELVNGGHEVPP